jgi:hypothetical protein
MTMVGLRRSKFVEPMIDYACPRCGESFACSTPEEVMRVNCHRLLHLAVEWDKPLKQATGWITDDDGGLRPVAD